MKLRSLLRFFYLRKSSSLEQDENLFSLLLENTNEIIVMIDAAQRIVYRSPSATRISGWTDEEVKQAGILKQTTHPDDQEKLESYIKEVLAHPGKTVNTLLRTQHKDGHYMYMEGCVRNLLHDKKVNAIIFNVREVTERVLREQLLAENQLKIVEREEQLRLYVEHSPAAIAMLDTELRYLIASRRWLVEYGLTGKDITGKSITTFFPGMPAQWNAVFRRCLGGEVIKEEEEEVTLANGKNVWLRWEIRPWYTGAGSIAGVIMFTENITERKLADEKLAASEAQYRQLLESISDGFIALDRDFNFVYANRMSEKMFGHPAEYFMGKNIWDVFPLSVNGPFYDAYKQAMETQRHFQFVNYSSYASLWLQTNVYPTPAGLTIYFTDITNQKKLEQELLEQQQKEQLNITAAIIEAEEKERNAIGEELHDNINQILTGIFLQLSRLRSNPQEAAGIVETSMQYLKKAIDENRKISRELITPEFLTVPLVGQLENLLEYMLGNTGCKINIHTGNFNEPVLNEKQKLIAYRVLQEQCTNITRYARATTVTVSLATYESVFKMSIADDGAGMDTSVTSTGIGLRNIKSRLSLLNGTMQTTTSPGKGFILEVSFPVNY